MAMPFIIHHNENIYSLEEQMVEPLTKQKKVLIYNSKHRTRTDSTNKSVRKTMGYAEVPLNPPDKFLKRGGGVKLEPRKKDHVCYHKVLPALPKFGGDKKKEGANDDQPSAGEENSDVTHGSKDICVEGEDQSGGGAKLKTIRKIPRYVDSCRGDTHDLKRSGLQPTYVYQVNYGKLPKYLIKRIHDAALQEEQFRDSQVRRQPLCRYVTQEERGELLGGLKHNWEELQKEYQGLPVLTDTIPKSQRKAKIESNLKQLEKDILLIENLPYIYVHSGVDKQ